MYDRNVVALIDLKKPEAHSDKAYKYVCVRVRVRVCLCVRVGVCICVHLYIHIYVYIYMCIHICIRPQYSCDRMGCSDS